MCTGAVELLPLDDGCKINYVPAVVVDEHKRRLVRIARPDFRHDFSTFSHHDCSCNQVVSLRNRVLNRVPAPTDRGVRGLRKQARILGRFLPKAIPLEIMAMPNSYSGAKKARYTRAAHDVLNFGSTRKDARVKMFVKCENIKFSQAKCNPPPRAIQFRDPKYAVQIGRYLKAIEHHLYTLCGDGKSLPKSRIIGKGLSSAQRGEALRRKMARFIDPVVVSLDGSRFDSHVGVSQLQVEHLVYLIMCKDRLFAKLLSWQLANQGTTSKGIRYRTRGKRMSGDMNTALGNCIIMVLMVMDFMQGKTYDMFDDGDDCLLIIERALLPWVLANVKAQFLEYGHEVKIEHVAYSLEEVEWCQSHPVRINDDVVKFVRYPWKVFSTAMSGVKYFVDVGARRKLINTIGMAELILNLGVPVLQEYAIALMRNASTDKSIAFDQIDSMYYRVHRELQALNLKHLVKIDPHPVTDVARLSYAKAFGVSVTEQLQMESCLRRWVFVINDTKEENPVLNVTSWTLSKRYTAENYSLGE